VIEKGLLFLYFIATAQERAAGIHDKSSFNPVRVFAYSEYRSKH
jgi:hypothetical protein